MDSVLTHLVRVVVHQSLGFLQKLIEAFKSSHIQAGSIYKSGCGASRSLRAATLTEKIVVAQTKNNLGINSIGRGRHSKSYPYILDRTLSVIVWIN